MLLRWMTSWRFVLVTGRGKVFHKADLLGAARKKQVSYERQDEEPGTERVRVWGDTAVVTALLWVKGVSFPNRSITSCDVAIRMFAGQ